MDSSLAGRAHAQPLMDAWNRQAPLPAATTIAPVKSVRPSDDPRHVRDRKKDGSDHQSRDRHASEEHIPPEPEPREPLSPAGLALQAIDPLTGQVVWEDPRPPRSYTDSGTYATASRPTPARGVQRTRAAEFEGLLGRRAYGGLDTDGDEAPHISRTA